MYNLIFNTLKTFRKDGYIEKDIIMHSFATENYMEGEGVLIKDLDFYKDTDYIISIIENNVPPNYELEELRRTKLLDSNTLITKAMYASLDKREPSKNITFEIGILKEKELNISLSSKAKKEKN